jgi:hypothetical protein
VIDEDKILADAEAREERLRAEAQFRMLKAGMRGTADHLITDEARENIARGALGAAILENMPEEPRGPGPALTKRPKVNARKRQRQARRRQRR